MVLLRSTVGSLRWRKYHSAHHAKALEQRGWQVVLLTTPTLRRWVPITIAFFIIMYLLVTIVTLYYNPHMIAPMQHYPALFLVPVVAVIAIFAVPFLMRHRNDGWAFIASCTSIALLLSLAAIGTYPKMIRSSIETETNSLDIFNAASSQLTLKILLIIVAIGIPLVLGYGFYVYRIFRGKVELDAHSY